MLPRMSQATPPSPGPPAPGSPPATPGPGGGFLRRVGTIASGTLISRILGLLRDRVIAGAFAPAATDAFFVAFTIPNALRGLVAEGAASAAVVPLATEARRAGGDDAAERFTGRFFGTLAALLTGLALVGVLAAPALVAVYAAGYLDEGDGGAVGADRFTTTVALTRWVFPYVVLVGLAGVATGTLHARDRFRTASLAPAWLNVGLIAAPVALLHVAAALRLPPVGCLALGALGGGAAHLITVAGEARRVGALGAPRFAPWDPEVREGFRRLGPLVIGVGVYQANVLLARLVASFLEVGAQSYLYYAQRLVEVPQGLLALAVAGASLPALAARHAEGDRDGLRAGLTDALGLVLFIATPAAVLLVVLAEPVVATLFRTGAFGAEEVAATAAALRAQALGVIAVSAARALVPAFHARGDTRRPVQASAVNLAVFAPAAPMLAAAFGHVGIALAIALAGLAQATALFLWLGRGPDGIALDLRALAGRLGRTGLASALAAGAALAVLRGWGPEAAVGGGATGMVILITSLGAAVLTFGGVATVLGAPEMATLRTRLGRRS